MNSSSFSESDRVHLFSGYARPFDGPRLSEPQRARNCGMCSADLYRCVDANAAARRAAVRQKDASYSLAMDFLLRFVGSHPLVTIYEGSVRGMACHLRIGGDGGLRVLLDAPFFGRGKIKSPVLSANRAPRSAGFCSISVMVVYPGNSLFFRP